MKVTFEKNGEGIPFYRLNIGDTFIETLQSTNVMMRIGAVTGYNAVDFNGIVHVIEKQIVILVECDVTVEII